MNQIPLTREQRDFAAVHHGLVYAFLNENHLPEDEFYDVVVFGYLRAVRRYFTEKNLSKYAFSTIAWNCMRVDLINHCKSMSRQKRSADVVSIYYIPQGSTQPLEEVIAGEDTLMQQLEMDLLLHDLAGRMTKQQMDMIRLRNSGYGVRDIARCQNTSMKCVKELLEEIRHILLEMCCE